MTIKLFIPQLNTNVNFEILDSVFSGLGIGHVYSANFMEMGDYQSAFFEIVPFLESQIATEFEQKINTSDLVIKFEDTKSVWEITQTNVYS